VDETHRPAEHDEIAAGIEAPTEPETDLVGQAAYPACLLA